METAASAAGVIKYAPPTPEDTATHIENARRKSALAMEVVVEALAERASAKNVDQLTNKQLLDLGEYFYKTSGMAAKAQALENKGSKFSITINIPGTAERAGQTITVGAEPEYELPERPATAPALFVVEDFVGDMCGDE